MRTSLVGGGDGPLNDDGDGAPAHLPLFDLGTFCEMIGFDKVWAFGQRWGGKA